MSPFSLSSKYVSTIFLTVYMLCQENVAPYRILMTSPQITSHVLEQVSMGRVLIEAGHEVHIVLHSKFTPNLMKQIKNFGFHVISFQEPSDFVSFSNELFQRELGAMMINGSLSFLEQVERVSSLIYNECNFMMEDNAFLQTLRSIHYDLCVVEPLVFQMCNVILPRYLNIPYVSLSNGYLALQIRSPALPSFYPRHYSDFDVQLGTNFRARFHNLIVNIVFVSNAFAPFNTNLTLLEKFAPGVSSWEDLLRGSLLFFYESDHHLGTFMPTLPNLISVAGLTCRPAKTLPNHILNFIHGRIVNGKEPGVILLSFGSVANQLPKKIVAKFLRAFGKLNETIIAKLYISDDDRELKSLVPANVLLSTWLPQNDILGYSKTKLFLTHCGNNGQHEALYHGVPMLGFPMFAEQASNCRRAIARGFGVKMEILDFTERELLRTITEMMNNPKYKKSIERSSRIFRDQPMTPQQKTLFWINHVIKFGGSHLRSSAMDMPLYQFLCFDSISLLILIVSLLCFAFYKLIKALVNALIRFLNKESYTNASKKKS